MKPSSPPGKQNSPFSTTHARLPPLSPTSRPKFLTLEQLQDYDNQIKQILLSSPVLKPLHVEVSNISCWYYMRRKLKAKRHGFVQIKPNQTNPNLYEGFIYDLKRRDEDLEIVPKKTLIHSNEDRYQVWKACEQAMKDRDAQRIIQEETSLYERKPISLMTHIKVTVVSDAFLRLKPLERYLLVYQELLRAIGKHVDPSLSEQSPPTAHAKDFQYLYNCPPSQMKGFGSFGKEVCQLPLFHFLSHHPMNDLSTSLIINTMTPSQWRPNEHRPAISERLGDTHLGTAVLQVNLAAKPKSQKDRVRKLTTIPNQVIDPFTGLPTAATSVNMTAAQKIQFEQQQALERKKNKEKEREEEQQQKGKKKNKISGKEMADSIGLDSTISGVKYKQLGGIYGHFFQDLSPEIKELVMLKYENNRELIRDESRLPVNPPPSSVSLTSSLTLEEPKPSFQPKTNASRFKTKAMKQEIEGLDDKGTKNPIEMREEVFLSNRKIELSVVRIQRIRRLHLYYRMLKWYWKSLYASITIQRCLRGHFGRRYFFLYQKLRPIAAMKIQRLYRAVVAHRIVTRWQRLVYRMTRRVLPKIKRFIKNCFLSWITRRERSAIIIQSLIRKRIAKVKIYQYYGINKLLLTLFISSVIKIQKMIRGYLGRKYFKHYLNEYLIVYINIPAIIRLQRIFRGRLGQKYLQFLRYEKKCLLLIQNFCRRFVRRKWDAEVRYHRKIKQSATTIQRYYRGYYDRKLFSLKYSFYYHTHVIVPSAIKVQSYIRRFIAQSAVNGLKKRWYAAKTIQSSYRYYRNYLLQKEFRRRLLEAKRVRYIVCIQKYLRRMIAYKKYQRYITVQRGKELLAAKIILRAWRVYKMNSKYSTLLEDFRIHEEEKSLYKYELLKKKIINDIQEIRSDITYTEKTIHRLKERLKTIDTFLIQCAFRLNKIQAEMGELVMEDFEKGWAEALGQEYEYLTYQSLMAREELRLIRHKVYTSEEELFQLY
eukprot:gene11014-12005_t